VNTVGVGRLRSDQSNSLTDNVQCSSYNTDLAKSELLNTPNCPVDIA
jgi:hypothetical protein